MKRAALSLVTAFLTVLAAGLTDAHAAIIYWASSSISTGTTIMRSASDGSSTVPFLSGLGDVTSIAIDASTNRLYFVEKTGSLTNNINRINLDGTGKITLNAALDRPLGLALDLPNNRMFWTQNSFPALIGRANLDGSNRTTALTLGGAIARRGIEIDSVNQRMYWVDEIGQVLRANLDGTNVLTLVAAGAVSSNNGGLALDLPGGKMYWTDSGGKILRANLDGTQASAIVTGLSQPIDIDLDPVAHKLFWSDLTFANKITTANLDGTGRQDILTGLTNPGALAVLVPEPTGGILLAFGLTAAALRRRRIRG